MQLWRRRHTTDTDTEVASWQPQAPLRGLGHKMGITWVDFSPDCSRLASASIDKKVPIAEQCSFAHTVTPTSRSRACVNQVVLWEVESGIEVLSLTGHTAPVYRIAFAKTGRTLFSASHDKTLKVRAVVRVVHPHPYLSSASTHRRCLVVAASCGTLAGLTFNT